MVIRNIRIHIAQGLNPSTSPIKIAITGRDISRRSTLPTKGTSSLVLVSLFLEVLLSLGFTFLVLFDSFESFFSILPDTTPRVIPTLSL